MFRKNVFVGVLCMCLVSNFSVADSLKATHKDKNMIDIATFDSGFGGFFTAKSIEEKARPILQDYNTKIKIHHFGDTKNAPYGEKTPEKIANMTSSGVLRALDQGSDMVFIACNTASTQYPAVQKAVEQKYPNRSKDVISIINASAQEVKERLDIKLQNRNEVYFAVLATPATIKSGVYPDELAKLYGGTLQSEPLIPITQPRWLQSAGQNIDSLTRKAVLSLKDNKKIHIYQMAPANWVDLIEHEGTLKDKNDAVHRDLALLESLLPDGKKLDGVGEFCTHYPVFDNAIQSRLRQTSTADKETFFIKQGPLMAEIFENRMKEQLASVKRKTPLATDSAELKKLYDMVRPTIDISGDNVDATQRLSRTVFPNDIPPVVKQIDTSDDKIRRVFN